MKILRKTIISSLTIIFLGPVISITISFAQLDGQQGNIYIHVNGSKYVIQGNSIYVKRDFMYKAVAEFPTPTVELLLRYRPYITSDFGYNKKKYKLSDVLEDVSSAISCAEYYDGKIWVGFGYYEGEGSEGFGGIGFYDLSTGKTGILRHPALMDYSAKKIRITSDTIFIQTIGEYETVSTVGNGLIELCRSTLRTSAKVPPNGSVIYDKDRENNIATDYDRSIDKIISDKRFLDKEISQLPDSIVVKINSIGLDSFMIQTRNDEMRLRRKVIAHARIICDTVLSLLSTTPLATIGDSMGAILTISGNNFNGFYGIYGFRELYLHSDHGGIQYGLYPINGLPHSAGDVVRVWFLLEKGMSFHKETFNRSLSIILKDVIYGSFGPNKWTEQKKCSYIKSISFRVIYKDLIH